MLETIIITAAVTSVVSAVCSYAIRQFSRLLTASQAQHVAELRNLHADFAKERGRLLERIQRPERIPTDSTPLVLPPTPEQEADDSFLVGSINWDDAYLEDAPVADDVEFVG